MRWNGVRFIGIGSWLAPSLASLSTSSLPKMYVVVCSNFFDHGFMCWMLDVENYRGYYEFIWMVVLAIGGWVIYRIVKKVLVGDKGAQTRGVHSIVKLNTMCNKNKNKNNFKDHQNMSKSFHFFYMSRYTQYLLHSKKL
jgi:hypothetical protein